MSGWRDIRPLVLERDEYRCRLCGKKPSAQIHHIIPRRKGGVEELSNLITLCGRCHMLLSPVPDRVLSKVWKIPPDEVKIERVKIEAAMEKVKAHNFVCADTVI